ncbi:MAG: hypothetical protein JWN65_506 [Solirubrobacterales bacterium]|nr:hypothetical protein [Solirubrobacterales bacterium]
MRTLVVSDLHLGALRKTDVLQRPGPLAAFCQYLQDVDRLVLLGDTVELRHGPARDALAAAEPVFAALGEALGAGGEIVLVGGNHDHGLLSPWLRGRGARRPPAPLKLDELGGPRAGPAIARLAKAAGPAPLTVRYPGIFIREDVYATHGHYLDCLTTLPAFERLGAGVMARIEGRVPEADATPDDFEALLAPMYAWLDALADSRGGSWSEDRQGASASAWELLSATGQRPLKARALASLFPLGIHGLNRIGIGPLRAELSGEALRDAGLAAMGGVLTRLGITAGHVLFGHTHRAGPLSRDEEGRWRVAGSGTRLYNSGCWIDEPVFARGGHDSPYWAGRAIEVDDEGPPRLVRVVADLGAPL